MSLHKQNAETVSFVPATTEAGVGTPETAEATAWTTNAELEDGQWEYIAIAETVAEIAGYREFDFDGQPGFVYTGPTGVAVHVKLADFLVGDGTEPYTEGGSVDVGLFLNNDLLVLSDEGGSDIQDADVAFNCATYVNLTEGDAIRVVIINEETAIADAYETTIAVGSLVIT
jgi:hypothetical protein